jgi:hypothetical protein
MGKAGRGRGKWREMEEGWKTRREREGEIEGVRICTYIKVYQWLFLDVFSVELSIA